MTFPLLNIGSRESDLAVLQANLVIEWLQRQWPELKITLKTYKTTGDKFLDAALSQVGEKGLFVKELEEALQSREIDLAIHSLKDMPTDLPHGLEISSIGLREDVRDILMSREGLLFQQLPVGATVGTSSVRRVAQLRRQRADLNYQPIRGNLQTRLRKLEDGLFDAIVLAAAGVHRLGWQTKITQYFDPLTENIPAVGQGILAAEFRGDDSDLQSYLQPLIHAEVEIAMQAERAVLKTIQGGCSVPLGAYAKPLQPGLFQLRAMLAHPKTAETVTEEAVFTADNVQAIGTAVGESLLSHGGKAFLQHLA